MEYVKVFLPATRKTRSLPGRVEQRWDAPLIPREVFEPRSRGGAGILRDIVQVSEPVAWPLSSCSTVFRPSLFARFLFRLHGPRLPSSSPSLHSSRPSLSYAGGAHPFLSFLHLVPSPLKRAESSETAFYLKEKKRFVVETDL